MNYGRDISCTSGIRSGRYATGVRLVAESAYRRLTTPRGMLRGGEEERNFGIDLSERIGAIASPADAASLPGQIAAELRKDERVEHVETTVVQKREAGLVSYLITIEAVTGAGPFTLRLSADAVTTELLGIDA